MDCIAIRLQNLSIAPASDTNTLRGARCMSAPGRKRNVFETVCPAPRTTRMVKDSDADLHEAIHAHEVDVRNPSKDEPAVHKKILWGFMSLEAVPAEGWRRVPWFRRLF